MIWQAASMLTGLEILLASPVNVFFALSKILGTKIFYVTLLNSFAKITFGFLAAFLAGSVLGLLSGKFRILEEILKPPVQLMKTLPITSFIILLLIWFGSENVAAFIAFIVVFPMMYTGVVEGIQKADIQLKEMARVFRVPVFKRVRCIYVPQILPFVEANLKTGIGMCWKAGVSAEVIGLVRHSIGEQLYYSKLYLATAELFAWSMVVVVASMIFEAVFMRILELAVNLIKHPGSLKTGNVMTELTNAGEVGKVKIESCTTKDDGVKGAGGPVRISGVSKCYGGRYILKDFSLEIPKGSICCIMGESGVGKTTLLRMVMGLENADDGLIDGVGRISAVFQENRLVNWLTTDENVGLVLDRKKRASVREHLCSILPAECIDRRAENLSGGMQRRTAVVRAMMSDCETICLDEPFTGLDDENKKAVREYILSHQEGRTILLVTHSREDAEALKAQICLLTSQ